MSDNYSFWRDQLANLTELTLPTDYPRLIPAKLVEAELTKSVSDKTAMAILQLSLTSASNGSEAAAPFDILLTAFAILLHKYTGEDDICIGSSSSSFNPLVLRLSVNDKVPFADLLSHTLKVGREAVEHEVPFVSLMDALFPSIGENGTQAPSLFKARFFNLTDTTPSTLQTSMMTSSCDLTVLMSQQPTLRRILPIEIRIIYNTVLFSESRIADLFEQLELVIQTAAKTPSLDIGKLSTVTESALSRLPDPRADLEWSGFKGAITDIFAKNAKAFPDRLCVVESSASGDRRFTYKDMNEASNIVAHHLIEQGIQREDVVVLYSYRGVDLVVAVMGVLKAGATFSVIDPAYPPSRQIIYLSVAQPRGLVVLKRAGELHSDVRDYITKELSIACEIPALEIMDDGKLFGGPAKVGDALDSVRGKAATDVSVVLGPDSIGTLSFTSGSTGIPKGVRGRHFSLTHFYPWMKAEFGLSEAERFTMLSGIAHDPIQRDIFTPLFLGASLYIPTADDIGTPGRLAEWMATNNITITHLTPAMGQLLSANAKELISTLRNAFFVGDVLTKRDVSRLQFLAENVNIINMYGTTETQRAVSYLRIPPRKIDPNFLANQKDIMPAGRGMKNVQLLVINQSGIQAGVGEVGEIYVRSSGLAEGYLRLEEVTATKFLQNFLGTALNANDGKDLPFFKGARDRMYRTGDLGRYLPDGSVECTGRADDQVKIRGFRIELGEIDTHLSQHPWVRENVTLVRRDKFEEPTLCSYFVPLEFNSNGEVWDGNVPNLIKDIREYLKQKLPHYAVPAVFAPLTRMPLTPNGKIDKNALPFPDTALSIVSEAAASTNLTPMQSTIRDVWASCLKVPANSISVDSNFFDLGGHSIMATQLIFQLRKSLAVDLPLGVLYKDPTIAGLSAQVEMLTGLDLPVHSQNEQGPSRPVLKPSKSTDDLLDIDIDYAQDVTLLDDPSIKAIPGSQVKQEKDIRTVFLTGATGFLGAFIVSSLLQRLPGAVVICLVRASSEEAAFKRLQDNLERHLLWKQEWKDSGVLKAICGDLGSERLGISEAEWEKLSNDVDCIVHNGALVHWVYPYQKLVAPNVHGTLWGLRLACTNRMKGFHFVSSTSVLDTNHYVRRCLDAGLPVLESDDLEGARRGLRSGYGQSKWVAEALVMRAHSRGVPVSIVRPGYIVGDSKTGVGNTDDFLWRLVKGCIQLGKVPRISNVVNMCPVNYVADVCAELAARNDFSLGPVFHMWNPHKFRFDDLFASVSKLEFHVEPTEYIQWRTSLMDMTLSPSTSADDQNALFPLLHFVLDDLPTSTRSPELDDANTRRLITGTGIVCGDIANLMQLFLSYFVAIGFLSEPTSVIGAGNVIKLSVWESLKGKGLVSRSGN